MLTLSQLYAQGSNFQVLDQINAAYNCCFTTCISTHVYTHTLVGHHLLPSNNPFVLARGVWDTRREKRKAIVNLFPLHIIPPWPRSRPLRFDGTFIEIHFFFFVFSHSLIHCILSSVHCPCPVHCQLANPAHWRVSTGEHPPSRFGRSSFLLLFLPLLLLLLLFLPSDDTENFLFSSLLFFPFVFLRLPFLPFS